MHIHTHTYKQAMVMHAAMGDSLFEVDVKRLTTMCLCQPQLGSSLHTLVSTFHKANVASVAKVTLSLQVVEFYPDSTIIETTKTPEQLNLQPRDISIFATNKLGVQAQRATITPRNGAVLFRTEIAKAIIYKDRAVLFHSRSALDFVSCIVFACSYLQNAF